MHKNFSKGFTYFTLPYNGDIGLVEAILSDYSQYVTSFYGSLGIDDFGGGRALPQKKHSNKENLKHIIQILSSKNIFFNYVLNNTNLRNREFDPNYLQKYYNFISELQSYGVCIITLSNPYFIEKLEKFSKHSDISLCQSQN